MREMYTVHGKSLVVPSVAVATLPRQHQVRPALDNVPLKPEPIRRMTMHVALIAIAPRAGVPALQASLDPRFITSGSGLQRKQCSRWEGTPGDGRLGIQRKAITVSITVCRPVDNGRNLNFLTRSDHGMGSRVG
jgi:hypothetical protein